MTDIEIRESSDGSSWHLEGLASTVETPYRVSDAHGRYEETIAKGAFTDTLARDPAVRLLIMHKDSGPLLARTGRNLWLSETSDGHLQMRAELYKDDPEAASAVSKVRHGLFDQMSFAFWVANGNSGQTWNADGTRRRVHAVDLDRGDVSLVDRGCNPTTTVSVRRDGELHGSRALMDAVGLEVRGAVDLRSIETGARAGEGSSPQGRTHRPRVTAMSAVEMDFEMMRLKHVGEQQRARLAELQARRITERDWSELRQQSRDQADTAGLTEGEMLRLLTSRRRDEQEQALAEIRRRRG